MRQRMAGARFMGPSYPVSAAQATALVGNVANMRFVLPMQHASFPTPHATQGGEKNSTLGANLERKGEIGSEPRPAVGASFASAVPNGESPANLSHCLFGGLEIVSRGAIGIFSSCAMNASPFACREDESRQYTDLWVERPQMRCAFDNVNALSVAPTLFATRGK